MTRPDHSRRVAYVLREARQAARRGLGLAWVADRVNMPAKTLRRFLPRHGGDDVVAALVAADSSSPG